MSDRPLRILFACTGLGRERRGFETFTRDCAHALKEEPTLAIEVFAGGEDGHVEGERVVPNLPRASAAAQALGTLLGRDPYFIEQGSFFVGLLPSLISRPPELIYFADLNLGNALWHWRRLTGAPWKLLFYNGGNTTMPYTRCDHVQLMTPAAEVAALARGERREHLTVLPHGVSVAPSFVPVEATARRAARAALGIPVDGEVLLSVGQLDRAIKRTHLLIEAVANADAPRPFLLLVGADGPDGDKLRTLAKERLRDDWRWMTVPHDRMPMVYAAADRAALLSHGEGFGLAYAEALANGLPLLVHDDDTTRYVVADAGVRFPVRDATDAAAGLRTLRAQSIDAAAARARHASILSRFGWAALRDAYVSMFHRVAGRPA